MSLNSLIFGSILMLTVTAQAQHFSCPASLGKVPLSSVDVFDGPPNEKADLVPDISKGSGNHIFASWDVSYIFKAGRSVYLQCQFGGSDPQSTSIVKVDQKVEHCIFRTHPGTPHAEVSCK